MGFSFPLHTRFVKWAFLFLAFGALLFLALNFWPSPALAPYDLLFRATNAPEEYLPELWSLCAREDGAGWIARVELSKVLLANGEEAAAASLLKEALSLRDSREARKLLAKALEKTNRPKEALEEWKKLLPDPEAADAVRRLEKDGLSAGKALLAGGAYSQALQALSGLASTEAFLLRARALVGLGRYSEAAQEYARYLALVPGDSKAQVEYGQVLERLGQLEKARSAYVAAGKDGAYRLGLLLEAQGALEDAVFAYLRSGEPEGKWRAARILEAQGRTNDALSIYQELARSGTRLADDAALLAYLILLGQGRGNEAASFKSLLCPAFLWLLGEQVPALPLAPNPFTGASEATELADALVSKYGEKGREWAYVVLDIALAKATPAEALVIGEWYKKKGDWPRTYAVGTKLISTLPCARAYMLAYPAAWEESVKKWAQEYGVDPFLVWAVMREESGFRPEAVSSSGACGLMQLLPSTARWIAEEKLRIPYSDELLFDPDYNIRLGTWYLRYLLEQFGEVAWAVAAYNGGPGNLRRWTEGGLKSLADLPGALRSPETREYLAKVLNSWLIYRQLYGVSGKM